MRLGKLCSPKSKMASRRTVAESRQDDRGGVPGLLDSRLLEPGLGAEIVEGKGSGVSLRRGLCPTHTARRRSWTQLDRTGASFSYPVGDSACLNFMRVGGIVGTPFLFYV